MKYVITDSRLREYSFKPSSKGANSVDLRACIDQPLTLYPNAQIIINTGIIIQLPENTMGMLLPRSGLGVKGAVLGNLVGNIDPDYRGEVKACIWNRNAYNIIIEPMDRIVQLIVTPVLDPNLWEDVEVTDETERGTDGFGSTGKN